ncbi:putative bifunctional diguanylate cyclase/phosphodiesterase [Planosporangium sp. 12N6]|uniref:putative bifunctional diguanylate cyclase/phosphodiesterase n=1 Tax=Planosporangium spinosum TaxID=3402278 RepID=UPI003CF211D4
MTGPPVPAAATATTPARRAWRPWRSFASRPSTRIAVLTAATAAATLLGQLALAAGYRWPDADRTVVLAAIAMMSFVTEGFPVYLRVRRGSHALSLAEIPLVLGVLGVGALPLLIARTAGGAVGMALVRRQRGGKLALNIVLLAAQATVAAAGYRLVAGPHEVLGPRQWLAAYAGMIAADALAGVVVTAAIALHDDPGEWRRLPSAVIRGIPPVVVTTSVALLGALVVERDRRAVALLAVVGFVTFLAYREYARQSQGHAQVEGLYAFTRALDGSLDGAAVTRALLTEVRDQLHAEAAELLVPGPDAGTWTRTRLSRVGAVDTALVVADATDWWAPAAQGRPVLLATGRDAGHAADDPVDGIAVSVPAGPAGTGVLIVTGSLPATPTFGSDQVRLFEALANHAGLSLAKAGLVDRLRAEAAEKEYLALHDPLTGLPNRRQFHILLEERLAAPAAGVTAVLMMDLDRFKEVNDALGHDIGDGLLREVADRLRQHLGDRGIIARLGGDEFAVLLTGLGSADEALAMGDHLTRAMDHPVAIGHLTLSTRVSIGIACSPMHGEAVQTLVRHADVAMYAAKQARAGARLYEPQEDTNSAQRLSLTADLARAVQRRELTVEFQPKLDPATGLVTGAEALARWHHPDQGFVPPDLFIPLAEHSGLIRPLTMHVLEVALRRCASWRRAGHDLHVAVNLSPNGLLDDVLPDVVSRLLGQVGVPPAALTLEITESALVSDQAGTVATLDRLHAIGVKLAIDDFGTGYSSLGRLRHLPIHEVKIDKSFVQRLAVDHRDRAVVRSAIQLGHALGLEVVAEGVEDAPTLEHLRLEGCDLAQGYFISRPLPADEFEAWLVRTTPP